MKPQDILILLTILIEENSVLWQNLTISRKLNISPAETGDSINRSMRSGLLDANRKVMRNNLFEFLLYGLKYVFPAIPGGITRGIPTAHSSKFFKNKILTSNKNKYVWPYEKGTEQGQSIKPLYKTVPSVIAENQELYYILSLLDAIRIGGSRENMIAKEKIKKWLLI